MKLAHYLRKHGIKASDFARAIHVTPRAVDHYINGQRIPRWDIILRIAKETDNAVSAQDWADAVEKKELIGSAA